MLARHIIYQLGQSITGVRVEELLRGISAVPTLVSVPSVFPIGRKLISSQNAFSVKLSTNEIPFNPSKMLVVDLLHEFELGVWKTLFKHLIRLLYAAAPHGDLVAELDLRCAGYLALLSHLSSLTHLKLSTNTHIWP